VGIPPAPRGIPQIEVTFDIDANGILHVSAKDLGTGKAQSIKITASSGLSKDEIDKMAKDAEAHADEDRKKRSDIEVRNNADAMVYQTEKTLKEYGSQVSSEDRKAIDDVMGKLRIALGKDNTEAIKDASDELAAAARKIGEAVYAKAGQQTQAGPETGGGQQPGQGEAPKPEGPEEADYKVVDEDKK
jgi:molecular chaperone DnaK